MNTNYEMFSEEGNLEVHKVVLEVRALSVPLSESRVDFVSQELSSRLNRLNKAYPEWGDTAVREAISAAFVDVMGDDAWELDLY